MARTWQQRMVEGTFRSLQRILTTGQYIEDMEARARAELDHRIDFYLLMDLNKEPSTEPDNPNNLTDEERLRWFGTRRLSATDITWEKFEQLLMPLDRPGAVFRVDVGGLQGSRINNRFSTEIRDVLKQHRAGSTEAVYTPQTITVYPSEEQAMVAAKVLRILTHGSGATIRAHPVSRGMKEPAWVVSDDMTLETHNALRLIFTHLAEKMPEEQRRQMQQQSQTEVDRRLDGTNWEAYEGVLTLLTLQGRPGVKMPVRLENGKDDPQDLDLLRLLPDQNLPRLVVGVPREIVIASDGRRYAEKNDTAAIIGTVLLGPNGYALLTTGRRRAIGELMRLEMTPYRQTMEAESSFEFGHHASMAVNDTISWISDRVLGVGGGIIAVCVSGSAMLAGGSCYYAYRRLTGTDPLNENLKPLVERYTGGLNEAHFGKTWVPRETGAALMVSPQEIEALAHQPDKDILHTPMGDVPYPAGHHVIALNGNEFRNFMRKNHLWPQDYVDERYQAPKGFFKESGFYGARDRLAVAFANWAAHADNAATQHQGRDSKMASETVSGPSAELAKAINDFNEFLRTTSKLRADTSNIIVEKTCAALTEGLKRYHEQSAAKNQRV